MLIVDHEAHVGVWIPVDASAIGRLFAAGIGGVASFCFCQLLQPAAVQIDDAEATGEFERAEAVGSPKPRGLLGMTPV